MPIVGPKNVNSVITTLQKKSIGPRFFRFFTKKSMLPLPYFVKKSPFSKKYTVRIPLFCQNTLIFKNTVISCHFFQNYHEKPAAVMPIFGQKTSILSKLYYGP